VGALVGVFSYGRVSLFRGDCIPVSFVLGLVCSKGGGLGARRGLLVFSGGGRRVLHHFRQPLGGEGKTV